MTKKKSPVMFRQGDVLIVEAATVPANPTKVKREAKRIVLAHGEVTGHAHAIESAHATLWQSGDGARFLEVKRTCSLQHEEHATITIPAGVYRVIRQREYTPEAIIQVAD